MEKNMCFSPLTNPTAYIFGEMDDYYGIISTQNHEKKAKSIKSTIKINKNKKLNILVTTFWNYPHTGGLSNYLTTFKKGFEALGHQVDVISPNYFDENKIMELRRQYRKDQEAFFIRRYGTYSKKITRNMSSLYAYEKMLRAINLEKYDLFHAQDIFTANILGRLNRFYEKPLVFTPHGLYTNSRIKFGKIEKDSIEEVYFRCIEKAAIANAVKTIIISNSFREPLCRYGASNEDLLTIHTGINMKEMRRSNNKSNIVITIVARLSPRKGHTHLFEALAMIKPSLKNVEVRIIGDGEMREELEHQVEELRLSMVKFFGERDDIPELLSESDIFILPTVNDNLPISIIEAMFGEQAIITTRCGGIEEIISQHKTGLLVEPGMPKELATHLLLLIQEPVLCKSLSRNAKEYALANLTSETMVNKMLTVYRSL